MELFKRILVDIDADAAAHPALDRALVLARATGAELTVTDVLAVSPYERRVLPGQLEEDLLERRRGQLNRVVSAIRDAKAEAKLLVGRTATVLIQEVMRSNHDLLMRSHAREGDAPVAKEFGAVDMELVRKCPCAVMLVRPGSIASNPRVAAAVNASVVDEIEQSLNRKIAAAALQLSGVVGGTPMIVNAWAPFGERMIHAHADEDAFATYVDGARTRAGEDLRALAQSLDGVFAQVPMIQRRGKPEDVIAEFVTAEGIDILVMGTVGRGGIPGLLLGNTAERVLRKITCSVLAIKPDDFVSPVRV
jgi:universal stress protein E